MHIETHQIEQKPHSLDEAFTYCASITNAHYENFPVASLFLPQEKRPYIQAIYAFSRIADDFADELQVPQHERLLKLNDWENKLRLCYEGVVDHPVFIALKETIKRQDIPIDPLRDLIIAFKQDVVQNRYETFEDLLSYCQCSANPVGRLVLMIFGHRDEKLLKLSDNICTALQLANFWQDIAIDRQKDRLYIPLEDMRKFNYSGECWSDGVVDDNFRKLMQLQVRRTRDLFYQGAELPSLVERDLQLELRLVWFGGMLILRKLEKINFDVFRYRTTLKTFNKIMILLRGLMYNDLRTYGKKRQREEPWDLT
ncbi:MAG: squalene synthase HpnC [Ignavibacteriae bacterium]|nr:squalene synthase HpnC [Ignavibacteriota bacterium]